MAKEGVENLLAVAVLSLLREKPMHPYEISTVMRERGLSFSIKLNFGSLYSVIAGLLVKGSIRIKTTEREGNHPERTIYSITESGAAELLKQLRHILSTPVKEYPRFVAGLTFLGHLEPAEARSLLEERAGLLSAELSKNRKVYKDTREKGVDELFLIEMDYALTLQQAELDWVGKLIGKIDNGTFAINKDGILLWKFLQAEMTAEALAGEAH
jgi:DNA-binding PadR family transcriptional regulator